MLSIMVALVLTWLLVGGLVQDCSISIALAMEILQSCTKPSKYSVPYCYIMGQCSSKCSYLTSHSLPVRARYGVSFSRSNVDLCFTPHSLPFRVRCGVSFFRSNVDLCFTPHSLPVRVRCGVSFFRSNVGLCFTPHSLLVRARYGVSFLRSNVDLYCALVTTPLYGVSYCIRLMIMTPSLRHGSWRFLWAAGPVFYLWLNRLSVNEWKYYMCHVEHEKYQGLVSEGIFQVAFVWW